MDIFRVTSIAKIVSSHRFLACLKLNFELKHHDWLSTSRMQHFAITSVLKASKSVEYVQSGYPWKKKMFSHLNLSEGRFRERAMPQKKQGNLNSLHLAAQEILGQFPDETSGNLRTLKWVQCYFWTTKSELQHILRLLSRHTLRKGIRTRHFFCNFRTASFVELTFLSYKKLTDFMALKLLK